MREAARASVERVFAGVRVDEEFGADAREESYRLVERAQVCLREREIHRGTARGTQWRQLRELFEIRQRSSRQIATRRRRAHRDARGESYRRLECARVVVRESRRPGRGREG